MIEFKEVFVTRSMARAFLDSNVEYNRAKKSRKIDQIAADIDEGNWDPNTGQTIKITPEGKMIDGQNRMMALLQSTAKGVLMTVAYGVPEKAILVVDTGSARTFADNMRVERTTERFVSSALIKRVYLWERGIRIQGRGGISKLQPTHSQLMKRYRESRGEFDAATKRGADIKSQKLGWPAPSGMVFFLLSKIDFEQAHTFFEMVLTGANLPMGHPALTLRNRLAKREDGPDDQVARWIRAWNFYRNDEMASTIFGMTTPRGTATNDTFPMPQ